MLDLVGVDPVGAVGAVGSGEELLSYGGRGLLGGLTGCHDGGMPSSRSISGCEVCNSMSLLK